MEPGRHAVPLRILPGQSFMARPIVGVFCIVIGVGLLVASLAWGWFVRADTYWDSTEQKEFEDATRALKEAAYRPGRRADQPVDPGLLAAQQRFNRIQARLERATTFYRYGRAATGAVGCVLLVAGSWLIWTQPRGEGPDRGLHLTRAGLPPQSSPGRGQAPPTGQRAAVRRMPPKGH